MDRDAIIREWFYRLPNGYANAPYSKEEMDTLHEVLRENGLNGSIFAKEVDQLDQAFHNAKPVDDTELLLQEEFSSVLKIDPTVIAQKVCSEIYDGVKTSK